MKKLRLEIDALRVESFGTGTGSAGGTVNGYFDAVAGPVIVTDPAVDRSRVDSCYFNTCYDTCDWGTNKVEMNRPAPVDRSRIDSCFINTCYDTCDWTA